MTDRTAKTIASPATAYASILRRLARQLPARAGRLRSQPLRHPDVDQFGDHGLSQRGYSGADAPVPRNATASPTPDTCPTRPRPPRSPLPDTVVELLHRHVGAAQYQAALRQVFRVCRDPVTGRTWTPVQELVCRCPFKANQTEGTNHGWATRPPLSANTSSPTPRPQPLATVERLVADEEVKNQPNIQSPPRF
jgi:hypothetical protein